MASRALSRAAAALSGAGLAALLIGLGLWMGRRSVLAPFAENIAGMERVETLGRVALERRAEMALAYDDPERAEREMDTYSWSASNVPTPFVGSAPEPGRHQNATIGEHQFRHAERIDCPKPPGTFRIFVTGGSTAYGTGAPGDDATITAFLRQRLERDLAPRTGLCYEVVNAANSAWASTHERILIENRLSEMEPDLVISLSGNNELHWGFMGLNVLWFRTYAETHFGAVVHRIYEAVGHPLELPQGLHSDEPVPLDLVLARLRKNLRLAVTALEPTAATYVFALQPTLAATRKPLTAREARHRAADILGRRGTQASAASEYFAQGYARFRAELPALELPRFVFLDLAGVFDDLPEGVEVFVDSYHFGDRGNRMLADALFEALRPLLDAP